MTCSCRKHARCLHCIEAAQLVAVAPFGSLVDGKVVERGDLVYCTYCLKTHAVDDDEEPCSPGAWLDATPVPCRV